MTSETIEDGVADRGVRVMETDAARQAALLLTESLIHLLLENGTLTKRQALDVIASAIHVAKENEREPDERVVNPRRASIMLQGIYSSVETVWE